MGAAMWATGQISIDRSDQTRAIGLKRAAGQVAAGRTVLLFPKECAARRHDGGLQEGWICWH